MIEVISLGAGVQSTTMALMAAHGEIEPMPDAAIFADTGAEPKAVYEHLAWLMSPNVLPFPVRTIRLSNMVDDLHDTARGAESVAGRFLGFVAAPFFTRNADGSSGMLKRECTENYKIKIIAHELKRLLGRDPDKAIRSREPLVRSWIGISADEAHRVNWKGPRWNAKRYPFLGRSIKDDPQDLWISRRDCEAWLRRHEYPVPPKSACTFCPYRSNAEWRDLRDNHPDDWQQAVEVDRLIRDMPKKARDGLQQGGTLYSHADRVPLDEVDLDNDAQPDLWSAECEGMCGL